MSSVAIRRSVVLLPLLLLAMGPSAPQAADVSSAQRRLHERLVVLDTHLDTPRHFARPGWRIDQRHTYDTDLSQVDYPRMVDGGLDGGFWSIFTRQGALTPEGYENAGAYAWRRVDAIAEVVQNNERLFGLATTATQALQVAASGRRIVIMSIENAYPLGGDVRSLERYYERGVRMIGPVHSANNQFADSATDPVRRWQGLSDAGVELVREANRLGMVVDASHASDEAFDQMLALSKAPIILSHSGCRAVYDHPRNIDDARLKALATAGGVIQINSVGQYLRTLPANQERERALKPLRAQFGPLDAMSSEQARAYMAKRKLIDAQYPVPRATLDDFMDHMLHAIALVGVDHVGIGADWDGGGGVEDMEDIGGLPKITARLLEAGFSEADLGKIMGGNALRVLRVAAERAERDAK